MRTLPTNPATLASASRAAPAIIAAGLLMLLAHLCWPALPVATPVALISLGTTIATLSRSRRPGSSSIALAIHLFAYTSLYLLLIGATCDAATRGPKSGLTLMQVIDLGLSAGVMSFVARIGVAALFGGGDVPTR